MRAHLLQGRNFSQFLKSLLYHSLWDLMRVLTSKKTLFVSLFSLSKEHKGAENTLKYFHTGTRRKKMHTQTQRHHRAQTK